MIAERVESALRTERLVFRAIEDNEADRAFLFKIQNDAVLTALSHPGIIGLHSMKEIEAFMGPLLKSVLSVMICLSPQPPSEATTEEDKAAKDYKQSVLQPIGFLVLGFGGTAPHAVPHRFIPLGMCLTAPFQNKGYGTEVLNWALDWAFRFGGYHRVALETISHNKRAQHVYERVGFVEEGRRRECHWHDGEWYDMVQYGILDREWKSLRACKNEEGSSRK